MRTRADVALEAGKPLAVMDVNLEDPKASAEISTRPFQLVTGRVWHGPAFGVASGSTGVPKTIDCYMDSKIEIDPMITHTMSLENISKGFDLMHEGKSIHSVVLY